VAELAQILIEALGVKVEPIFSGRSSLVSKRQADPRKARDLLGFECEVLPRDGLAAVAREIASHPELY
jgi:UDP-glucose 4-epimerase